MRWTSSSRSIGPAGRRGRQTPRRRLRVLSSTCPFLLVALLVARRGRFRPFVRAALPVRCPAVRPSHAEVGLGARAPGQRRDGAGASRRRRLASDSLGAAGGETFGSNLNTVRCPL